MKRGDIVLVPFPFTNLRGAKRRPAVILHKGEMDVIVTFITSNVKWEENTDLFIAPSPLNGLKKASLVRTGKLATLELGLIIGKIGELDSDQISELLQKLKILFNIS